MAWVAFERPEWLWLAMVVLPLAVLIGRSSLSGLSPASRRVALAVRLLVLALLVATLARPQLTRQAEAAAVVFVVDRSRSVPLAVQERGLELAGSLVASRERAGDRAGLINAGGEALLAALPKPRSTLPAASYSGSTRATDLGDALGLALAVRPPDAGTRVVLLSDGNQTSGDVLAQARRARSLGVPVDVAPLTYDYQQEVVVERLLAPPRARAGEAMDLRVTLRSRSAASGRLTILANGRPLDGVGGAVSLEPGLNSFVVPVEAPGGRTLRFEAVFEPDGGDAILENNRALATTFVAGSGRVLVLVDDPATALPLLDALRSAELAVETGRQPPQSLAALAGYDAVVMVDQAAAGYSIASMRRLVSYVHDAGGGLLVVGGPRSFGAGGWIGTPLADALPVRLDPPQKRQLPRGALALVLDTSGSMGSSVAGAGATQLDIAKEGALAAIDTLTARDLVSVIRFDSMAETVFPMAQAGTKEHIAFAVRRMAVGGGTNMFPGLEMAAAQLEGARAAAKHVVVLSDGQTSGSQRDFQRIVKRLVTMGASVSTVTIGDNPNDPLMRELAAATDGRYYPVKASASGLAELPRILIREAQTVTRALIWEGTPFSPTVVGGLSEAMRGIDGVPPIGGYVVTGDREGLATVSLRGPENDPILAQWQHGLGRVVAYTSDLLTRWNPMWAGWGDYERFLEQHVRWAMRASGDANIRVVTEADGDRTRVVVLAADPSGRRLNFARFDGRVALPGGEGEDLTLTQTGPGRYEGVVETADAGSYVLSLRYDAPGGDGGRLSGTVQAAIDGPFSGEFAATTANEALLRQVAQTTGGRVLDLADPGVDPWRREGLTMPRSRSAIWPVVAMAAIGLFLLDVAVRRVRVDVRGVARLVRRGARGAKQTQAQQIDALRAARAKAQERLMRPDEGPSERVRAAMRDRERRAHAAARYEPADDTPRRGGGPVVEGAGDARRAPQPAQQPEPAGAPRGGEDEEQGMSRLLKAKRRTRDQYEDQ